MDGKRTVMAAVLVVAALTAAACGDDTTATTAATPDDAAAEPDGGAAGDARMAAVPVPDALAVPDGATTPVIGTVIVDGTGARLCELVLESFPPQCGGASLTITNPEALASVELASEGEVSWSEGQLTFDGVRRGADGFEISGVVDPDWTDTPGDATPPPTDTGVAGPVPVDVVAPDAAPGSRPVNEAEVIDARPHAIDLAVATADGGLEVLVWGGVADCWAVADVVVTEHDDAVEVTVLAGPPVGSEDRACIAIAELVAVPVPLDAPLGDRAVLDLSSAEPPS